MADIRKLAELCRGRTVYIQTHNFPDPDAIGSAFGLQRLMQKLGIETTICYDGTIDKLSASKMLEMFGIDMHSGASLADTLREEDYIICVDSQKHAGNITDFTGNEIACIDHHPTFVKIDYLYEDVQIVGACATLIAEYYKALSLEPDTDAATALLYGLKMDTQQFTRGVTGRDVDAFGFLLPFADEEKLAALVRNTLEFQDLRAYGAAIENIRVFGKFGFSHIPFSCPDAMIAILADFVLSLIEVEVAVLYCDRSDGMKFSVRSERDDVDAGKLIRQALEGLGSGGGHAIMAGGLIPIEKTTLLGNYPDDVLRDRFLKCAEAAGSDALSE